MYKRQVLHVHDDVVVETDAGNLDEVVRIMEEAPEWCEEWIVKVDAVEANRWVKP